jgi:hypothetical protein
MLFAGLLSTMNMWTDKLDDIRFSWNDIYMIFLMIGWMFLFMGIVYKEILTGIFGGILVGINLWCIRKQYMVNEKDYILGMIPHHSMAVHMSKRLLEKEPSETMKQFAKQIIQQQEKEIRYMKQLIQT